MKYQNFIREIVLLMGASPTGVMIGIIGATVLTLWGINGKAGWAEKVAIIVSGATLCGYTRPAMIEHLHFSDALANFCCLLIGFASPYFFMKLKVYAPLIFGAIGQTVKKRVSNNEKEDGKDE